MNKRYSFRKSLLQLHFFSLFFFYVILPVLLFWSIDLTLLAPMCRSFKTLTLCVKMNIKTNSKCLLEVTVPFLLHLGIHIHNNRCLQDIGKICKSIPSPIKYFSGIFAFLGWTAAFFLILLRFSFIGNRCSEFDGSVWKPRISFPNFSGKILFLRCSLV